MSARILIVSLSDPARDPRVARQVDLLSSRHSLALACYGVGAIAGVERADLGTPDPDRQRFGLARKVGEALREGTLAGRLYGYVLPFVPAFARPLLLRAMDRSICRTRAFRVLRSLLSTGDFELVLANDFSALALCDEARGQVPLFYDAHEYSPGQSTSPRWLARMLPVIMHELKMRLHRLAGMITVSKGIAREYAREFGIPEPTVVTNAPLLVNLAPRPVEEGRIRLVHHGLTGRMRALETMIDAVASLDARYTLDFYLVNTDDRYLAELKARASGCDRIRFREPVPMQAIPSMLNAYDIGLALFPPATFNLKHVLPNKFFEFVQGRIGVAIGPSEEMAAYVREYGLGVVAADFSAEALAAALNRLSREDVEAMKARAHMAAPLLSGERQMEILGAEVEKALARTVRAS